MLRPRIIPCLLVRDKGLVKTVRFADPKYVGDPLNAVKIFNEKAADELMVLDIDATRLGREPDFEMIRNLAVESRMPLCYGGGVRTVEQARRIINLGAEKVAISHCAIENPSLVSKIAEAVGVQSVVAVIDVKKRGLFNMHEVMALNGTKPTGLSPVEHAVRLEKLGAGEIVLNSIDQDGTLAGYDLKLMKSVREVVSVPMTLLGGAGSLEDIGQLISKFGVVGAAAGSLFVFKGKYRAVLISYPSPAEKRELFKMTRQV